MRIILRWRGVCRACARRGGEKSGFASDLAYAFDDELLRGLDVTFLRDVDALVEAMVAEDPSLARVAPEMVTRDLAA